MQDAAAVEAPERKPFLTPLVALVQASVPSLAEVSLAIGSALLLILSFPNFDRWVLAWIALVPVFIAALSAGKPGRAFILGWLWGVVFFYGSCWWLTYSMIHYGHLRPLTAYLLLTLPVALGALFPALSCLALAQLTKRFGSRALFAAPVIWVSAEWARYMITGEAWNAIGYSQAYHPSLIQGARWGGVYGVSFLIVLMNASVTWFLVRRNRKAIAALVVVPVLIFPFAIAAIVPMALESPNELSKIAEVVIAVQPNVPMEEVDSQTEAELLHRHLSLSSQALERWRQRGEADNIGGNLVDQSTLRALDSFETRTLVPTLVIWPESPMGFAYSTDPQLQEIVSDFAIANHTSVLLNSLEPAPNGGAYNSAILVNQEGRKVAQYDKIRLMPFGEYVPLPRWLPGASSVRAIVGEFTPGSSYTLMPLGAFRAGVFICFESAHPAIARALTNDGAEILINISNDGYLGPTPVMRQHLANAIFRAVENERTVLRVTNTGITALIDSGGRVSNSAPGFEPAVRTWAVRNESAGTTFYTRSGDLFVYACLLIALGLVAGTFFKRQRIRISTFRRG